MLAFCFCFSPSSRGLSPKSALMTIECMYRTPMEVTICTHVCRFDVPAVHEPRKHSKSHVSFGVKCRVLFVAQSNWITCARARVNRVAERRCDDPRQTPIVSTWHLSWAWATKHSSLLFFLGSFGCFCNNHNLIESTCSTLKCDLFWAAKHGKRNWPNRCVSGVRCILQHSILVSSFSINGLLRWTKRAECSIEDTHDRRKFRNCSKWLCDVRRWQKFKIFWRMEKLLERPAMCPSRTAKRRECAHVDDEFQNFAKHFSNMEPNDGWPKPMRFRCSRSHLIPRHECSNRLPGPFEYLHGH